MVISEDKIILIQITTGTSPAKNKMIGLGNAVTEMQKGSKVTMKGWFISLFECDFENKENVTISQEKDLTAIIGKEILIKMKETKEFK